VPGAAPTACGGAPATCTRPREHPAPHWTAWSAPPTLLPMTPLTAGLGAADLAVLERWPPGTSGGSRTWPASPQARPPSSRPYNHRQMTERCKDHPGALCVVAASLAERAWTVMRRGTPYVICDTDGQPVTAEEAKKIIAGRWTVPPEIRARRRSKKTGKAPQKVLAGQYARGDLPRGTTPPQPGRSVKQGA